MEYKKIIPYINAENELEDSVGKKAADYEKCGADELFIYNYSSDEKEHEEFLSLVKRIVKSVGIPVIIGVYVKKFEDIKKAFYTGAKAVTVSYARLSDKKVIKEGADRFGKENIILEIDCDPEKSDNLFKDGDESENILSLGEGAVLLKHVYLTDKVKEKISSLGVSVYIRDSLLRNSCEALISIDGVEGISTNYYEKKDIMKIKHILKDAGIKTNVFESSMQFKDFKKNSDGMLPVIVQDYKTNEVLMLAYMDEQAYNKTIETGVMTYYSRSRNELWIKGETSGHYQYVRAMYADCDTDTILAKVMQVGAACHTGARSCFFNELVKKEYDETNPLTVFDDVYNVIMDRKTNPKEGSYTNYLFDKGIDKILKKCGEEATEIVIAAKNPDKEEIKYEIADYLYHLMVLMAECGVDWEDITGELAHRR